MRGGGGVLADAFLLLFWVGGGRGKVVRLGKGAKQAWRLGAFIYTKQLGMRHYRLRNMRYEVLYEI
jgi:hypothetical protein